MALLLALGSVACASTDATCLDDGDGSCAGQSPTWAPELPDSEPLPERLQAIDIELTLGSQGDEVRAVHEYLTQFGYFPSDRISALHSQWRPVVAEAPADAEFFDEQTAAAIVRLQTNAGLPPTGNVDEATLSLMRKARCGFPDGDFSRSDAANGKVDKFDHGRIGNWGWDDPSPISYRVDSAAGLVDSAGNAISAAAVTAAVKSMLDLWAQVTNVTAAGAASLPGDPVEMAITSGNTPGLLAQASYPDDGGNDVGGDITLGTSPKWSNDGTPTATETDLRTVLLHEIGHAIGLAHSSFLDATMEPFTSIGAAGLDRTLAVDDKVSASYLYDAWFTETWFPSNVRDIGVGGDSQDSDNVPDAWVAAGATTISGGYEVRRANHAGLTWDLATGNQGAVRISVGQDGRPWIVASNGNVYKRSTTSASSGTWGQLAGCATDIGVGGAGEGTAWVLGCTHVAGGYRIFRWNGSSFEASVPSGGAAVRIAVDTGGVPWVVAEDGKIWKRTTNVASSGTWTEVVGSATDIGIGPAGYAWVVNSNNNIFVRNDQVATVGGSPPPVERHEWMLDNGLANTVAVGSDAQPWVIGTDLKLYWRKNR